MKSLYDSFVQWLAGTSWSQFIATVSDPAGGMAVRSIFRQDLYLLAPVYLLFVVIAAIVIYYFVINRKGGSGYGFRLKYWFVTLISAAFLLSAMTTATAYSNVSRFRVLPVLKYCLGLGIVNAVYLTVLFFLASIIVKKFSVANRTPF